MLPKGGDGFLHRSLSEVAPCCAPHGVDPKLVSPGLTCPGSKVRNFEAGEAFGDAGGKAGGDIVTWRLGNALATQGAKPSHLEAGKYFGLAAAKLGATW